MEVQDFKDIKIKLPIICGPSTIKEQCLFCKKASENKLSVLNEKKDILYALGVLGVKYEPIQGCIDLICYQCVYRLNVIVDYRRMIERNLSKSRANYYYREGNKEVCLTYLKYKENESRTSLSTMCSRSDDNLGKNFDKQFVIENVRTETDYYKTNSFNFDSFNCSTSEHSSNQNASNNNSPSKLLEPMYETSESVLATESGGKINLRNILYTQSNYEKYYFNCRFCAKSFKRYSFLKKHEKRHILRMNMIRRSREITIHDCSKCSERFNTLAQLRNHMKVHRRLLKCAHCNVEKFLKHDLDLHEAECLGKLTAHNNNNPDLPKGHYTRSKSLRTLNDNIYDDDIETESMYSSRMRHVKSWVNKTDPNYKDDDSISIHSSYSTATSFTRASSHFYSQSDSSIIVENKKSRMNKSNKIHSDRLFTTKMNIIGRNKFKGQGDHDDVMDKYFACQDKCCSAVENNLQLIMKHDITEHKSLPLHICKECKKRFTRRIYLKQHLVEHFTNGNLICNKCLETFNYIHELKYHFELHDIRDHKCEECGLSFLKEPEFLKHLNSSIHINRMKIIRERYRYLLNLNKRQTKKKIYKTKENLIKTVQSERPKKYIEHKWELGNIEDYEIPSIVPGLDIPRFNIYKNNESTNLPGNNDKNTGKGKQDFRFSSESPIQYNSDISIKSEENKSNSDKNDFNDNNTIELFSCDNFESNTISKSRKYRRNSDIHLPYIKNKSAKICPSYHELFDNNKFNENISIQLPDKTGPFRLL